MASKRLEGKELTDHLDRLEREGMAVTQKWFSVWRQAVQYMWGQQLQGIRRNPDWDYIVVNYIYPLVMQGIAKLSKNQPKIICRAWKNENAEWAEQWQGLIHYAWEQILGMRMQSVHAMLDSALYGYAVGKPFWRPKVYWDDQIKGWVGEIGHRLIHPAGFWCDPNAESLNEAEGSGTVRKVTLEWAIQQWPEFEKQIRESVGNEQAYAGYDTSGTGYGIGSESEPVYENQRDYGTGIRGRISNFVNLIFGQHEDKAPTGTDTHEQEQQYVWVREAYFRDYSEDHVKIEDPAETSALIESKQVYVDPADPNQLVRWSGTGTPVAKEEWPQVVRADYYKPRFPRGRMVIRVNDVVVNPKPDDQVYKYSRWPFLILPYHILPHMWQGSNAVDMSRSSQDMLNLTVSYILQHTKMSACPQKVVEANTLAKDKHGKARIIRDKAGEMIVVEQGKLDKIKNLTGDRLDPTVWSLVQYLQQDLETQQFMHAVAQGKASKNMSATEAARLDTNANDLIAMRSFTLERWAEGDANLIAEILQEHYEEGRRIRVVDWTGQAQPAEMTPEMKTVEWDLEVEPGTTLPFDEERVKQDYLTAYKLCGDPNLNPMLEEVLRKLNIANRDKILAKHQQLQVFKMIVQLAQQYNQAMGELQQAAQQPGPNGEQANPAAVQMKAAQIQQVIVSKVMGAMQQMAQAGQQQPQLQGAA